MTLRQLLHLSAGLDLSQAASAPSVSAATRARVYYDTATRRLYVSQNAGAYFTLPLTLGTQTASATVANTTTQTTFLGTVTGEKTLPANSLVVGKTLRIRALGVLSSTSTPNLTIVAKLGSTTVATTGVVAQTGTPTNVGTELSVDITCRTAGASGSVFAQGFFRYGTVFMPIAATAAVTLDTTAAQIIDLTATWSVANSGNTITGTNCVFELLN